MTTFSFWGNEEPVITENMCNEEKKLAVFKANCKKIRNWFFFDRPSSDMPILLIPQERINANPYLKCIKDIAISRSAIGKGEVWTPETGSKVGLEEAIQHAKSALVDFSDEALKFKKKRNTDGIMFPLTTATLPQQTRYYNSCELVFWHLLALAYEEPSREESARIDDFAIQIGFTKTMLQDWKKALEYILDENVFDNNCTIDFESEEAKIFFLHIYERSELWKEM